MFRATIFLVLSSLSLYANQNNYAEFKTQVEKRWDAFQSGRTFKEFALGRSDRELEEEFENIDEIRHLVWEKEEYKTAEYLREADLVRCSCCPAFPFNNTVPFYNASTIFLGDKTYIACEGPRFKDVPAFFNMLTTQGVTHLVRVTGAYESWKKKCHPYWHGLIAKSGDDAFLNIPRDEGSYSVQAFHMDHWRDGKGIDPDELLAVVLKIRQGLADVNGLLAVHCSAGVGRTGTFLAALAIVDAIDKEEPFSIEEIVYRLSFQRIYSVAAPVQYVTLYRFAETYLKTREARRAPRHLFS